MPKKGVIVTAIESAFEDFNKTKDARTFLIRLTSIADYKVRSQSNWRLFEEKLRNILKERQKNNQAVQCNI